MAPNGNLEWSINLTCMSSDAEQKREKNPDMHGEVLAFFMQQISLNNCSSVWQP